ncbi:uncharacterized protein [Nicotiana sylvestris]|uniref:Uncharacterized protein LOC104229519 n=1 Tax=Nicotiana sylvestris TaxID=4096 RepID=A0A1U7X0S4_NICSY|nr:PREDICTED: uncharacterized protein LOC104229519 [Nicotiana sylvestris]
MLQLDGVQLPELKCKYLTLKLYITKCNLYEVASLLRASPHVKTLNIDMEVDLEANIVHIKENCRYESCYLRQGDNIDLESWISNYAFPSLKSVNIICSTGMCQMEQHDKLFELSEFLLKNAMILEKFVIIAKRAHCCYCLKNCVSQYSSGLAAKLLGCPRPSTNFTMIFAESDFPRAQRSWFCFFGHQRWCFIFDLLIYCW